MLHILAWTVKDLKAFQEATSARTKRASPNGKKAQKSRLIKVSECQEISSKKKKKGKIKPGRQKEREVKKVKQ